MEGRDKLMESVTPSESASVEIRRVAQLERERCARDRKKEGQSSSSGGQCEVQNSQPGKPLPDLPGSDLDPPSVLVQQSICLVERWIQKNDTLIAMFTSNAIENKSLVSTIRGGIKARPEIDVGIWRKTSGLRSWGGGPSTRSSISSPPYTIPTTELSNCVYDKPSQDLHVDMQTITKIARLSLRKNLKHEFQRKLSSILQHKKAEKLARKRKISTTEAVHLHQLRQRRRERKNLMSGTRSNGSSPRTSLENIANSSLGRTSFESSIPDSISLTASEVERCVRKVGADVKGNQHSSTESSSLFNSRPSAINLGRLLQQSPLSTRETAAKNEDYRYQASTLSSLNSSRPSAINFGSFINEALSSSKEVQQKVQRTKQSAPREIAPMDTSSYKPTAPVAIGRPLSPATTKSPPQLRRANRQIPRKLCSVTEQSGPNRGGSGPRIKKAKHLSKEPNEGRSDDELPSKSPYVKYFQSRNYDTSDTAQNASRRRARRESAVNDKNLAGGMVEERKQLPRPACDSSSVGGMTRERKEDWKPKATGRSGSQIFAGSLNPDGVQSREQSLSQAPEDTTGRRSVRRGFVANGKTLGSGVVRKGNDRSQPKFPDRSIGQSRGKIDPEYIQPEEAGVSDVIKNSRRRRAERSSASVPFNDRYRNEERKKAWSGIKS